jgi:4-hydroxy-tetrahydrodipicolinate synthase
MFTGVLTALVTPMRGGQVDVGALTELVEWQIAAGVDGLVPCGTTGEAVTLSPAERALVIETVVRVTAARVPVVAGAGTNSTAETIDLARAALDGGADGLLVVCPYYNKPTQAGLAAHFRAVLDQVDAPLVLYNIPGRTGVDLGVATFLDLARHERVVGIKEASGSVVRAAELVRGLEGRAAVLAGDDALYLPILAVGGRGIVSASACVAPEQMVAVWRAWQSGDTDEARDAYLRLLDLFAALFAETNPGPAKLALQIMGKTSAELRLPLVEPGEQTRVKLDTALRALGLVS